MIKIISFVFIVLLFSACSQTPQPIKPSQKAFDKEDFYIMYALRAEEVKQYATAAKAYEVLFVKSHKKEYLYKELQNRLIAKDFVTVEQKTKAILENEEQKDPNLLRFLVLALVHEGKLQEAKQKAVELVKLTKKSKDYLLVADIYVKLKKYNMAIKYLEGGYSENYDEEILDRISIILYVNLEKPKDAIAQLETHSRMFGCSKLICARLLSFYSNQNDVDGMLSVYKRMYEKFQNEEFLEKIIQLYVYKKDFMGLRVFLQKNNVENEMLLQLYLNSGEYEKAYKLAYKLYEKTQNIDFLGKGAMYEYESYKKPTKKQLLAIVQKLKKVVQEKPDGLYLNYLGYLLIDHDLDVKEGMQYVKQALTYAPDSAFYLDSLAWGYYKLHECKKADKLFKKIVTLKGGDDPEVVKHQKAVQQCLKKSKGKK